MSDKNRQNQTTRVGPGKAGAARRPGTTSRAAQGTGGATWRNRWVLVVSGLGVALVAVVAAWALLAGQSGSGTPATPSVVQGTVIQANGGHWTNVTPDTLAAMLQKKDFTLLNVKTPYIGEIAGTDLYIPYTDLTARAGQLPTNKAAKIVVYCRTGTESAIAAQTLLDLGYTNVVNLAGGMTAWTASGRQIVQLNRG